jgi:hypothetical protein
MTYADLQAHQGIDLTPHPADRPPEVFCPCAVKGCAHPGSFHTPEGVCAHIGCDCTHFVPQMDIATRQGQEP